MSDTHRQSAILQAIEIIADKKLSQASFDKTIKAVVKEVKDKATGEYIIKYQDSEFTAYATSSDLNYAEGEQVYILIPGNDWDRNKTILNSVNNKATTFVDVPTANNLYNRIGTNLITLEKIGQLSSYKSGGDRQILYSKNGQQQFLTIDNNVISRYIKAGNALALGIKVRTDLDSGQVGGDYGLVLNLKFKNDNDSIDISEEQEWENAAIRSYIVSSKDVIGNPYHLRSQTIVEALIKDINIEKFLGVDSVEIFCDGFPQDNNEHPADIFISGIYVYGADSLTEEDLNGYVVHIDYSETGNILDTAEQIDTVKVKAQLKAKGQIVNQGAQYYWFRQNGLIFKGSPKYNGRAGDGWQCLNAYANTMAIPQNTGQFIFKSISQDRPAQATAACFQKVTKVRCVIVYQNRAFTGDVVIYNHNARSVSIDSSDKIDNNNKTVYYLNSGSPTLTAIVDLGDYQIQNELSYTWSVIPQGGNAYIVKQTEEQNQIYRNYLNNYLGYDDEQGHHNGQKEIYDKLADANKEDYTKLGIYQEALEGYNKYLNDNRTQKNQYINFPINSIRGSSKIICAVQDGDTYIGTGSITLYNKLELQGSYSLSIDNGTQVFQYDNKGNSPTSEQLEKPLELKPLTFTLLDNTGKEISYEEIVNNGYVKWLLSKEDDTLLKTSLQPKENPLIYTGQDKEFYNQGYNIYQNKIFPFTISERYDKNKKNNDIRLVVKYKDLYFEAYSDFTFPKDGDPGTNGTDIIGKVILDTGAERLHGTNNGYFFDSFGNEEDKLNFVLYNNSVLIENEDIKPVWQLPPNIGDSKNTTSINKQKTRSHFKISNSDSGKISLNNSQTIDDLPYVDIVRAKYTTGEGLDQLNYYAEYPVCYEEVTSPNYRIRVKPKSGFEYVVYSQDGTRPDYDNLYPFEVIPERLIEDSSNPGNGYWINDFTDELQYNWEILPKIQGQEENPNGQFLTIENVNGNQCTVKPVDKFDGEDLSSSIVCHISSIGTIYIPVYMILNRYGHQALNGWDGNSIELNNEGNYILAPQIGAGKKETDNSYTGIFMGTISGLEKKEQEKNAQNKGYDINPYKIGLAGYNHGARTIFLDSESGKAQFGKNGAGKIILDPNRKIKRYNKQNKIEEIDSALIYSGNYPIEEFLNAEIPDVKEIGNQHRNGDGMIIDLSTPQIGFGSGNFTVNSKGELTARGGGQIAGWSITDNKLHKNNKVGMASQKEEVPSSIGLKNNSYSNDTVAFWAGGVLENNALKDANFYATHGGYLYSKLGQIAGWNFNSQRLIKNNVGMNSDPTNESYILWKDSLDHSKGQNWPDGQIHTAKAFFANGDNFYVTHDGYLRSTSGKIASWNIDDTSLTNGNVGMGSKTINKSRFNITNNITAKFWAGSSNNNENFAVTAAGDLYSRSGKIGGWNIGSTDLSAKNIIIDSSGNIRGGGWSSSASTSGWGITSSGDAYFNSGKIGKVTINAYGISGTGWYIHEGDAKIPGLKVNQDGSVSYTINNYGSGVTGNGMHIAGSGGTSSFSPSAVQSSDSGKTIQQQVKEWVCEAIGTGTLTIYDGISVSNGQYSTAGHSIVIQMTKTGAYFYKKLQLMDTLILSGTNKIQTPNYSGGGANQYGRTGKMTFSDQSWMGFSNGLLVDYEIKSASS